MSEAWGHSSAEKTAPPSLAPNFLCSVLSPLVCKVTTRSQELFLCASSDSSSGRTLQSDGWGQVVGAPGRLRVTQALCPAGAPEQAPAALGGGGHLPIICQERDLNGMNNRLPPGILQAVSVASSHPLSLEESCLAAPLNSSKAGREREGRPLLPGQGLPEATPGHVCTSCLKPE